MGYLLVLLCCLVLLTPTSLSNALSCKERFGGHCDGCNETECTRCDDGHCGSDCSKNCTGFCNSACHKRNCSCIDCIDGYYGDNCSSPCSGRCYKVAESESPLCHRNGTCPDGCKYGFCLPNTTCSARCSDCADDDCDAYTCTCRKGCRPGFRSCGETPKIPSTDCENCRDQTCRRGGVCTGCKDGYYGENCEKTCTDCDICHQLDGECIPQYSLSNALSCKERFGGHCDGCNETECTRCDDGHCGSDCSKNCTGFCNSACHKRNCSCIDCIDGYYGDNCSSPCSGRCYKVAESKSPLCHRNGTCPDGCKYGFCLPNTTCSARCSDCADDDCDAYTCTCRKGCRPGFRSCGETPKIPSTDCENCRDQTCRRGGVCIGCKDGYYGENCEKTCTDCDICHQLDGECIPQYKRILSWCWSYAGLATFVSIVFGGLFLWCCRKNRHIYSAPGPH